MKKYRRTLYIWNAIVSGCILILVITLGTLSLCEQCKASDLVVLSPEDAIVDINLDHQLKDIVKDDMIHVEPRLGESIKFVELHKMMNQDIEEDVEASPYIEVTEDEIYLVAQILYLEARGETIECQEATVSVIMNRMTNHNMTVAEVIFEKGQFSTADNIDDAHPSDKMIERVRNLFISGPTIPEYVTYFRAGRFHEWDNAYGKVVPWDKIDNTYFSYDVKLKAKYDAQLGEE